MIRSILLCLILLLTACSNFLFVPTKAYPVTPDAVNLLYEDIFIEASDGIELHGWKLLAEGRRRGTILFFHGNGDNVSTQLPHTFWIAKAGYDVYIFDYREYGQSQGEADLDATIGDMEVMIAYVAAQLLTSEKLNIIGHSLGGSMAVYAVAHSAHRDKIGSLVTIEAFSDYHDVTQDVLARSWLFWAFQWPLSFTIDNSYRPLDAIGLVSPIPVMIMHSKSDEMIDISHAEKLFDAAKEPKTFQLIVSQHNNIFVNTDNRKLLLDYLSALK